MAVDYDDRTGDTSEHPKFAATRWQTRDRKPDGWGGANTQRRNEFNHMLDRDCGLTVSQYLISTHRQSSRGGAW